jgi:hypothetical protein
MLAFWSQSLDFFFVCLDSGFLEDELFGKEIAGASS